MNVGTQVDVIWASGQNLKTALSEDAISVAGLRDGLQIHLSCVSSLLDSRLQIVTATGRLKLDALGNAGTVLIQERAQRYKDVLLQ